MLKVLSARARRVTAGGAVVALLGSMLVWSAPSASAASCATIGGFEIDGNMTVDACGDDWANVGPASSTTFTNIKPTNDKNAHNPVTDWTAGGNPAQDSLMNAAYSHTRIVGGDYFAFVGWHRASGTGTSGFIIELDNRPDIQGNGLQVPDRSGGGVVLYLTAQGGSTITLNTACSFTGVANYPGTCGAPGGGDYLAQTNGGGQAINPITSAISPMATNTFLEVGLNLSHLTDLEPGCPASSSAVVHVRSYTGNFNLQQTSGGLSVTPPSTCVLPAMSSTATPGNSTIDGLSVTAPGTLQHDVATVGTQTVPGVGGVKFFLCSPATVTANGGDCSANGTQVGSSVALNGGSASSGDFTVPALPTASEIGKYCWRAEFTPNSHDEHYTAAAHTNSTTECFTVAHASPAITTQVATSTTSGAVANSVGFTTIDDTGTLTPVVPGADLSSQHLTFELYGPFPTAPTASSCIPSMKVAGAGGDAALTKVNDATWQAVAPSYKPSPSTGAGYYTWVTHYDGDAINDAVPAGGCGTKTEAAQLLGASVSVAKGTPNPTISAGDKVVYDLNVQNVGAGTAAGVVVTDTLPVLSGGGTWTLNATPGYNCAIATVAGHQVVTCDIGDLNPIASTQIAEVSATTTPADCGTIANRATLSSDGGGQNTTPFVDVNVQCPHLSIQKTADHGVSPVSVGTDIGFTITVTNDGQGTASGVKLTDTLPTGPGITWTIDASGTHGFASCAVSAGVLTCTGSLAQGVSAVVHVTSPTRWTGTGADEVNSCLGGTGGTGTYDNTAQVEASNVVDKPTAHAAETVLCPDLQITKTADAGAVNAGTDIGFTVAATNAGNGTAKDVTITDKLPGGPGVHWFESPDVAECSITGPDGDQVLTCSLATLAANTSFEVHVQSKTTFASCHTGAEGTTGTYANTAGLTASNDPQKPSDHATVLVECADLVITKTADHGAPVNVGSPIGFTITVTNNGTGTASGVLINDLLPAGPGIVWTVDPGTAPLTCGISAGSLTCTGTLAPAGKAGDSAVVHLTSPTKFALVDGHIVDSCHGGRGENGTFDNTATVTWNFGPDVPISSNQAEETVVCPDLAIEKTADSNSVSAGEPIGFTITVHNSGLGVATGATITDTLPTGTGIVWTVTDSGNAVCDIVKGVLTCTRDLAADTAWTVHLTSTTEFASCGTYDNVATTGATNAPPVTSDPAATTTVNCPKVTLAKSADAGRVDAGSPIGFTVAATNGGAGTAFAMVIVDVLPKGDGIHWTLKQGAPEGCSIAELGGTQTLTCSGVDLRPGETESVGVVSQTGFASCTTYNNTATATVVNQPGILTDSASTTVLCSALVLGKTADAATVNASDQIGYTVTLTNADTEATGTAKSVTINDPLPAGPTGSGVDWAISPAYAGPGTCQITGVVGSQKLTCSVGDVSPGASISVHVISSTAFASCAVYENTATLAAANAPTTTASASTIVQCPALTLAKTADAAQVPSGGSIGFTLTATNGGPGTAANAAITDPLPAGSAGSDVSWAISPAYTGPGVCTVTGSAGSQLLACAFGALAAGTTATVHIVSTTTTGLVADCASYDNSASLTSGNAPALTAAATTTVVCPPLPTEVSRTPAAAAAAPATASGGVLPLAITGSGRLDLALFSALALVVLGAMLTLAATTRRRRSH